jgi:hypothetical protein
VKKAMPVRNPKKRKGILQRDLDDGCVLQGPEKAQVYTLNISAAFVWELCDGKHTVEKIAEELALVTKAEKSKVIEDVRVILKDFKNKKLLQTSPK